MLIYIHLGPHQKSHVYKFSRVSKVVNMTTSRKEEKCETFLDNIDSIFGVHFKGNVFHLPHWYANIFIDYKHVAFNTAKVVSQTSIISMKIRPPLLRETFDSINRLIIIKNVELI